MRIYRTATNIEFTISTFAGLGVGPFDNHPQVWEGDKCNWSFPILPPIGSIISAGPIGSSTRVQVVRYDFTGSDHGLVLVLITSPVRPDLV